MGMQDVGAALTTVGVSQQSPALPSANRHHSLSPYVAPPAFAPETRYIMERFFHIHPDAGLPWELVTPAARQECQAVLEVVEDRTRAATYEDWYAFLFKLSFTTANAPSTAKPKDSKGRVQHDRPSAFEATVVAIVESMGYVPVCALHEGYRECSQEEFFPRSHALVKILSPHISRALNQRTAVQRIARGGGYTPTRRVQPSEAEKAHVRSVALGRAAEAAEKARQARHVWIAQNHHLIVKPRTAVARERLGRGEPLTELEMRAEEDARTVECLNGEIARLERDLQHVSDPRMEGQLAFFHRRRAFLQDRFKAGYYRQREGGDERGR